MTKIIFKSEWERIKRKKLMLRQRDNDKINLGNMSRVTFRFLKTSPRTNGTINFRFA